MRLLWTQALGRTCPHPVTLDESFDLSLAFPRLGFPGFFLGLHQAVNKCLAQPCIR